MCHHLDGIPLAIELAAARVRALSVDQIARRLDDRFRLLTTGHRTALPHHQTLRAAMDWSYELLSKKERVLFRRLAIFAGGLTLDAVEEVGAGHGIEAGEILDLLVRLVDKSLVVVHGANQEVRHGLLETVRQYARGRLEESGDAEETAARHRDYFLGLAERAEPKLRGPEQAVWLARLDLEHDNLRAALEWSMRASGTVEPGLRLAGALWEFWYVRGHWTEGRLWLEKLLSQSRPRASGRAKALIGAAALAWCQGDDSQGIVLGEQSLILCRELDDKQGIATALNHLAHVAFGRQEYERATPLGEQSLKLCRELGDKGLSTFPMNTLGRIALHRGDVDRAEALFKESLTIRTELGDQWGISSSLRLLGNVAAYRGDYQQAEALHKKSLALSHDLGDKRGTAQCLEGLAGVAMARGNSERAAQLLGAAEALRDAVGFPVSPVERVDYDHRVGLVRDALGKSAFTKAWTEARTTEADRVIEDALKL